MSVRLSSPGLESLELDDGEMGYVVQSVEVGSPQLRPVVSPRALASGTIDRTMYAGSRAVTVGLTIVEGRESRKVKLDRVARFLAPGRVSELALNTDPGAPARVLTVRAGDFSMPWNRPSHLTVPLSFVTVGTPFFLSEEWHEVWMVPEGSEPGRSYLEDVLLTGRDYDRTYPYAEPALVPAFNDGDVPVDWQAVVAGPFVGFTIANGTTGERLSFPTLDVPAGQTVVIDTESRTVLANGDPGASRYGSIDFAASTWFQFGPGMNSLKVTSSSFAVPAATTIRWRDAYLT